MMELIDKCLNHPINEIMELPDVKERTNLYFEQAELFKNQLANIAKVYDKVIVLEEGVSEFGWGAEIGYNALSSGRGCKRIGARKSYIPAGKVAEAMVLPCVEDIAECMIEGFR